MPNGLSIILVRTKRNPIRSNRQSEGSCWVEGKLHSTKKVARQIYFSMWVKRAWGEWINSDIWAKIWTFAGRKAYGLILQGSAWIFCRPVVRSGLMKLDLSSWYEDLRGECNYEQLHRIRVIPCEAPVLENIPGWITKSCLSSSIQDVSWPKTVTTFAASNWETIHLKTVILSSSPNTYTYQEKTEETISQRK